MEGGNPRSSCSGPISGGVRLAPRLPCIYHGVPIAHATGVEQELTGGLIPQEFLPTFLRRGVPREVPMTVIETKNSYTHILWRTPANPEIQRRLRRRAFWYKVAHPVWAIRKALSRRGMRRRVK